MDRAEEDRILAQAKEIEEKRRNEWRAAEAATEARINGKGEPFKDEDLVYAAAERCKCGAGFAYPSGIGMHGAWYCSHLLKTRDPQEGHEGAMPFAFWSVRSESQIARNNGVITTRPEGAPWGKYMEDAARREGVDLATAPVARPGPRAS